MAKNNEKAPHETVYNIPFPVFCHYVLKLFTLVLVQFSTYPDNMINVSKV